MNFSRISPNDTPLNPPIDDSGFILGNYSQWLDSFLTKLLTVPSTFLIKSNIYISIDIARRMINDINFEVEGNNYLLFQCGEDRQFIKVYVNKLLNINTVLIE